MTNIYSIPWQPFLEKLNSKCAYNKLFKNIFYIIKMIDSSIILKTSWISYKANNKIKI